MAEAQEVRWTIFRKWISSFVSYRRACGYIRTT